MHIKRSIGDKIFDFFNYSFFALFLISILFPFVYMFSESISDYMQVGLMRVKFLPIGFQLNSYMTVLTDPQILSAYWNSVSYTVVSVILALIFNSLAAFALCKPNFKSKNFFLLFFTITMFFSGGMIPGYLNIKNLGLLDTMWSIVLPAVGMWYIILFRTNFAAIPSSLIESAFIDGAGDWYIFFKIILPLSKAILATIAVFVSVATWNNYFGPLLFLSSPEKQTLTIILRKILVSNEATSASVNASSFLGGDIPGYVDPVKYNGLIESLKMATVFITIGPIILVYPFAQKYFVKGVMVGAIKG